MAKKKFNPEVDLVKFFFSVVVMLYHSKYIDAIAAGEAVFPYGFNAVEFFFIVSGFLMAKSSIKYDVTKLGKSTFDFVLGKIKAIYPYFFFAFVTAFCARQTIFFVKGDQTIIGFCKDAVASLGESLLLMKSGVEFGTIYNGPTWYIGAMIFAMAIIFPILLKHREWFINIGSIVLAIFMYALAYQEKHTLNYLDWAGWTTMSIIRAIAGVSLGCFVFALVDKVQKGNISLKKFGKVLFWLLEVAVFGLIVVMMQFEGKNRFDFVTVIFSALLCFIIFSGLTGVQDILPSKLCAFLGKWSLLLYLNHRIMTRVINYVFPDFGYLESMAMFFALTIIWSIVAEIVVNVYKKLCAVVGPKVKKLIFE